MNCIAAGLVLIMIFSCLAVPVIDTIKARKQTKKEEAIQKAMHTRHYEEMRRHDEFLREPIRL
jgi:hypothetical protein